MWETKVDLNKTVLKAHMSSNQVEKRKNKN